VLLRFPRIEKRRRHYNGVSITALLILSIVIKAMSCVGSIVWNLVQDTFQSLNSHLTLLSKLYEVLNSYLYNMKAVILSTTLASALVSAMPHYGRGSLTEWAPGGPDDCMYLIIRIFSVAKILI
jgi:hypothetical protein